MSCCSRSIFLGLAILVLSAGPSVAQGGHLELFGGYYDTDIGGVNTGASYGARAGWRWGNRGIEGTISRFETDRRDVIDLGQPQRVRLDLDLTAVDLSAVLYLKSSPHLEWMIFGGPGWMNADLGFRETIVDTGQEFSSRKSTDVFTLHFGTALRIPLSERIYVRPDVRTRWIDDNDLNAGDSFSDLEVSVSVGFKLF